MVAKMAKRRNEAGAVATSQEGEKTGENDGGKIEEPAVTTEPKDDEDGTGGTDPENSMKSIMHKKDGTCYLCMMLHADHSIKQTQEHHAIHGRGRRKLSERYGLKVHLCFRHHTADGGSEAVHRNAETDLLVKKKAQQAFEKRWPRLNFQEIFGKNYLEEADRWQQASREAEKEPGFRFIEE